MNPTILTETLDAHACSWSAIPSSSQVHSVRDFISLSACCSQVPSSHFALHNSDIQSVNAFCRFPDWEQVHFAGNVSLPLWVSNAEERAELLSVAVASAQDQRLTAAELAELQTLLNDYSDIFSESSDDLGLVSPDYNISHAIDTGLAEPITQVPYQLSKYEQDFLQEQLQSLLRQGCIRPSTSAWMSPVVLVKKKDNTLRLCIDFRALNKVTLRDPYPLPLINTCINKMAGCKYFTSIDVVSAFWQVPVAEQDIHKTGFCTPFGNFEWLRMPFGLVNASSTFQRLMDVMLAGVDCLYPYIDDVFVYSKTWADHLKQLQVVFQRVRAAHVKLKLPKCIFGAPSVKCLGSIVSEEGVAPDPEKISAMLDVPAPSSVKEVKSVLGMASFYSKHINDYARIVCPMHALTHKGVVFRWDKHCAQAFQQLKSALTSASVLKLPDWTTVLDAKGRLQLKYPFNLCTDWSLTGMGAVLSQPDSAGNDFPIAFAGKILSPAESRYAPTEGECCALTWALGKFRHYLHGYHFTVYTDHQALIWLSTARFTNAKLERWALKLQEYNFTVLYKKGSENVVADFLSRPATLQVSGASVWPSEARSQGELDQVCCDICQSPEGWDNMVICDGCDRCMHLRCLIPPQTVAPSGKFYCVACNLEFQHPLQSLQMRIPHCVTQQQMCI